MININIGGPQATKSFRARKTLDGNLMIMDHDIIDIVLLPESSKILTFPKSRSVEDAYNTQARFFDFLSDKGVVDRETVQGGNIFRSLEALLPEGKGANSLQAAVYVISEFLREELDALNKAEEYEKELENYFVDPTDRDSTELGEVPQHAEKGAMIPGYYYIPLRYRL